MGLIVCLRGAVRHSMARRERSSGRKKAPARERELHDSQQAGFKNPSSFWGWVGAGGQGVQTT